jgi:hypothetical protein
MGAPLLDRRRRDERPVESGAIELMADQSDLTATCAFLATYLEGRPAWLLQVGDHWRVYDVAPTEVHVSGSDGEHCYRLRPESEKGRASVNC